MKITNDNIDLTEEAISIFGDIVEYAYVLKPRWCNDFNEEKVSADESKIEPRDGYPVFVKFKNGKEFEIRSSEWGGVYSTTEKEYVSNQ